MTPEGRVKKNIRRVLDSFGVYYFMPVQGGYGPTGVDFHCVVRSSFVDDGKLIGVPLAFFIEAKKPGGEPTGRQDLFMKEREEKQSARTFVIDDDPTINQGFGVIDELVKWLEEIEALNEHAREAAKANVSVSG